MTPVVLHTVPEALARLGIGRTTLYTMIGSGDLDTVHIGSRILIPSDSIDQFIANNRQVSPADEVAV